MLWQIEDLIPTIDARVVDQVLVSNRGIAGLKEDYGLGCLVYMADPGLVCGSWRGRTAEFTNSREMGAGDGQTMRAILAAQMPHSLP